MSKEFETLIKASAAGDVKKMQAAIEAGADVNGTVEEDQRSRLKRFLKGEVAPLNFYMVKGDTPLHVTLRNNGSIECVRLLIGAGADVNTMSPGHGTPLILAISKKIIECVKMLIEAGADVNSEDPGLEGESRKYTEYPRGTSPSSLAINYANVECLKTLLDAEADVRSLNNPHNLSFWFYEGSSLDNKIRCLQLLLTKGAHVNQPGDFWGSALESFLSFLGENESALKGVKLIMAAGENGGSLVQVKASGLNLRNDCRESIRRHLLSINNNNLFVRVAQLPLPAALKNYVLYDVTLDEDYVINDVTDDVEFICEKMFLPRFEVATVD